MNEEQQTKIKNDRVLIAGRALIAFFILGFTVIGRLGDAWLMVPGLAAWEVYHTWVAKVNKDYYRD